MVLSFFHTFSKARRKMNNIRIHLIVTLTSTSKLVEYFNQNVASRNRHHRCRRFSYLIKFNFVFLISNLFFFSLFYLFFFSCEFSSNLNLSEGGKDVANDETNCNYWRRNCWKDMLIA